MRHVLQALLVLGVCGGSANGQMDLLTLRESEAIVERVPEVAAAREAGECPTLAPDFAPSDRYSLQVRRACEPASGQMIDSYSVDRRSGAVNAEGDGRQIRDPRVEALARELVGEARARILSLGEARCLALEAARAVPGWREDGSSLSLSALRTVQVPFAANSAAFVAEHTSASRLVGTNRLLIVDRSSVQVLDFESSTTLASEGLGELAADLRALRAPVWLTEEDAARVGLQVPEVAARVGPGCRLVAAGVYSSDRVQAIAKCDGGWRGEGAEVDLATGDVTDLRTGRVLTSSESGRLARQILQGRNEQHSGLEIKLGAMCPKE
jgi:hypothetical protein